MSDNEILALMYDFYNKYVLKDQNKYIDYYINQLNEYSANNVLVVGAGTGRVAIPLSDYVNVSALDFDLERLKLLNVKSKKPSIIYTDFVDFNHLDEYDLIIFPYSTIQFGGDYLKINEIFNKLGNTMNKDAVCLFDVSENFNNKVEKKDEFLFKTFCNSVNSNVEVYYTSKRYKDFIEFLVRYKLSDKNREVLEKEKYTYYDKDLLLKGLEANNLSLVKIDDGYGEGILKHKHIYHCRRIK